MGILRPNAKEFHNPSREYISRLLSDLQKYISMSEIARRLGVNRSTIYNYMRDETDKRFTICPYAVQYALEEMVEKFKNENEK
ncbi:TPA: helix-turn-helix domain-containing protein [Pasteurella multocida]|uniref:HTH domain-containing protein n=1 Tax=Pasteurella multocida TaxID=747 RepID=UPI0023E3B8EC|nr:HTH domain-containing protein [Pasteurella multocida]HDR1906680.1 helix-turn-helix domain-containing protein [Pasteurella multocida]